MAAAVTAARGAAPARPPSPARPRRRATPHPRGAAAPMAARLVPLAVGRTAVAVSELADSGVVQRLTRGRLWIGALTTLLVGIVALNVLTLSFNATASRVGQQGDNLKREISALRARIATSGESNARVQDLAASLGFVAPEPGSITYLRPKANDAATAARRIASGELAAGAPSTSPAISTAPAPVQPAPTTDTAAAGAAAEPATTTSTTAAAQPSTAGSPATSSPQPSPAGGAQTGGVAP
jgi:hypothetical protein